MSILTKLVLPVVFIATFYFPFFLLPFIPHDLKLYRHVFPYFCIHIDPLLPAALHAYSPCLSEAATSVERTLMLLKPDVYPARKEEVMKVVRASQLDILKEKEIHITLQQASQLYAEHSTKSFYNSIIKRISSAPVYAIILSGPNAIHRCRAILGPTDPAEARRTAPGSLRALFGTDKERNAAHGSDSKDSAATEIDIMFA